MNIVHVTGRAFSILPSAFFFFFLKSPLPFYKAWENRGRGDGSQAAQAALDPVRSNKAMARKEWAWPLPVPSSICAQLLSLESADPGVTVPKHLLSLSGHLGLIYLFILSFVFISSVICLSQDLTL